ncbi:ROK family transcriptional regulator [Novisyntrophococcus fermenticellae]|uniref:ROK family transcriptional regulator n=1 Tax=Novisyntrophococcus fermenticellae TaxID=2068655 RepID=UPI001E53358C|nr:ROK family transcriptional regulator [Novisyntrophococcus fermenticellae]
MKSLYSSIAIEGGISRTMLARQTHLSKTTVSTLVDELIDLNFIVDEGVSYSDNVGRKPNCLKPRSGQYYVIVLRWIEHTAEAHVVDITGFTLYTTKLHLEQGESYISLSQSCVYNDILKQFPSGRILGICIVVSAMIDAAHNEIYSTTLSLGAGRSANLIHDLYTAFPNYPVALLEDTACYAYAEKVYARISQDNFAFINFGRGIGATIFIDGKMLGKASGSVTQFGHYTVDPHGPLCACGNHGCLESMLSEGQLKISFEELGAAAQHKDPAAIHTLRRMAKFLALALSNLICIVNPELIILGGKGQYLGNLFLEEVKCSLKDVGFRRMVDGSDIRYSTLHSDACLNGAMKYFFDTYYSFLEPHLPAFYIG